MAYYDKQTVEKLKPYLDDYTNGVLKGIEIIIEYFPNIIENYMDEEIVNETILGQIKEEIIEQYDMFVEQSIKSKLKEYETAAIDNCDYSINEKGEVIKDVD